MINAVIHPEVLSVTAFILDFSAGSHTHLPIIRIADIFLSSDCFEMR